MNKEGFWVIVSKLAILAFIPLLIFFMIYEKTMGVFHE